MKYFHAFFSFAVCFTLLVSIFRFLLFFSLSVAPRNHSSLMFIRTVYFDEHFSELRSLFVKVVPYLSLEAEAIRAPGAEPRLQEHTNSASRVGRCRERGMLMSRTLLSLLSCRANSLVGLACKIHVEVLYNKKKNQTNKTPQKKPKTTPCP